MGGRIINNGSISAYVPRPDSVAYTSTKHAISGLTKQISLDRRKYNIACSQIDVGNAATPMTATSDSGQPQPNGDVVPEPRFNVSHVGESVLQISNLPLDTNIQFMTIMATKMPYVGRGQFSKLIKEIKMDQENLGTITMDDVLLLCKHNKVFESQLILIAQSRINTEQKGEKNALSHNKEEEKK